MKFTSIFVAATGLFAGVSVAAPAAEPLEYNMLEKRGTCYNPIARKEWRQLNILEKSNYLLAVKCMMIKPSKRKNEYPAAKTRWDDFIAIHQEATPRIHFSGQFLPWHRAFLHEFETALRQECFYFGAQPYWDHTLDRADIFNSPVVKGVLSFGGNGLPANQYPGQTGGGCITDGLFKDTVINIAPWYDTSVGKTRCIKRSLSQTVANLWFTPAVVSDLLATNNYEDFAVKLEGDIIMPDYLAGPFGIHNAGHAAIGGDMTDMYTSPLDPIFWLHHAYVDRLWAKWQAAAPSTRQFAMGLPLANRPNPSLNWAGAPAGNIGLDYPIYIDGKTYEVGQIMDTKGTSAPGRVAGALCYKYAS